MSTPVYGDTNTTGTPLLGADNGTPIYADGNGTKVYGSLSGGGGGGDVTPKLLDMSGASYDSTSYTFTYPGVSLVTCFEFSTDGTKAYVADAATDRIYQHTASTPFDITTLTYDSVFFSTGLTNFLAFKFATDGTGVFLAGNNTVLYYRPLSTPWDLSTAGSQQLFVAGVDDVKCLDLKPDGTELYLTGSNHRVRKYSLPTPNKLSGITYVEQSAQYSNTAFGANQDGQFNNSGQQWFVANRQERDIITYTTETPYDVTGLTYDATKDFSVIAQETAPYNLSFNSDYTKMFVVGTATQTVYQYSVPEIVE